MADHFYLQLHALVEYDPRIASMPRGDQQIFTQMRLMALRTSEPGVLELTWDVFCRCMRIRNPVRMERLLNRFAEAGLMGLRESDGFIVLAGWTMPQLDGKGAPRPTQKPSDVAEATRERKRRERERRAAEIAAASTQSALYLDIDGEDVTPPCHADVTRSAADVTPPVTPCHAPYKDREIVREESQQESKDNNSISYPADKSARAEDVVVSGREGVISSLIAEGITRVVAERLAQNYPAERICRQIGWIDQRNVQASRPGTLRKAIEEDWTAPKPRKATGGGSLQDMAAEELAAIRRMEAAGTWIGAST